MHISLIAMSSIDSQEILDLNLKKDKKSKSIPFQVKKKARVLFLFFSLGELEEIQVYLLTTCISRTTEIDSPWPFPHDLHQLLLTPIIKLANRLSTVN